MGVGWRVGHWGQRRASREERPDLAVHVLNLQPASGIEGAACQHAALVPFPEPEALRESPAAHEGFAQVEPHGHAVDGDLARPPVLALEDDPVRVGQTLGIIASSADDESD